MLDCGDHECLPLLLPGYITVYLRVKAHLVTNTENLIQRLCGFQQGLRNGTPHKKGAFRTFRTETDEPTVVLKQVNGANLVRYVLLIAHTRSKHCALTTTALDCGHYNCLPLLLPGWITV